MSMQDASALVAIGRATRADVAAALGNATVVRFDSGREVWVYRAKPVADAGGSEFVLLFTPDGLVSKTRIRPDDGQRFQ